MSLYDPRASLSLSWAGSCLASQGIKGGAGPQDGVRGLWACAIAALVCVRSSQSVEMGEEVGKCPVVGLKMVTCTALPSGWMLCSSVP